MKLIYQISILIVSAGWGLWDLIKGLNGQDWLPGMVAWMFTTPGGAFILGLIAGVTAFGGDKLYPVHTQPNDRI